jgi:hypothetical protein
MMMVVVVMMMMLMMIIILQCVKVCVFKPKETAEVGAMG